MSSSPIAISVIVCAFADDRWDDLVGALNSIQRQGLNAAETIVVTDHNDGLRARVAAEFPWARVVPNSGQQGLSDARNTGVAASSAPIVAFLDDDAVASPGWLEALADPYRDQRVIGVGGAAIPAWDAGRPAWFPDEFDWVVGCSYRGLPTHLAPIRNPLGCNMSFRREAFAATGGFDTSVGRVGRVPVGGEETEFCIRLRQQMPNHVLLYQPTATVRHRVRAERATWRYFKARCVAEGRSKARITTLVGAGDGLASERRHAAVTLPRGVARHLSVALRELQPAGVVRAGAIVAGLGCTVAGYAAGRMGARQSRTPPKPEPTVGPAG